MSGDREAARRPALELRRWTCPLCWRFRDAFHAPLGWLVVEPFARVAACAACASRFKP